MGDAVMRRLALRTVRSGRRPLIKGLRRGPRFAKVGLWSFDERPARHCAPRLRPDRLVRDHNPALGEQVFDVAEAEREPEAAAPGCDQRERVNGLVVPASRSERVLPR